MEETVELSRLLAVADVDVIHASGGHHARMEYEVSPWFMPRAVHRHGWEYIKRASSIPVIASGSIVEPILAAEILRAKTADFVSLGRPMLADPDWAKKAQEGRLLDIVPCIRCNDGCLHRGARSGRSAGCTVNPHMGEEYRYSVKRVSSPKRIAVAGGGPAGLRAAAVLADRGHNVTLFEPNALGGLLVHATRTPIKRDLARLLDHLVYQVSCRDVEVLAEMATADGLCERGYDAAVIATGTKPRPLAASLTNDAPVIQAVKLEKIDDIGPPVIIVGGGLTGCNIALWFAESGIKDVTILEAEEHLLAHNEVFTDSAGLPNILKKAGITICTDAHVTGVASDVVYAASKDGAERIFPARRVIVACGYEPNHQLADELVHRKSEIETFVIGTARSGSRVMDALRDAFFVARLT